MTQDPRLTVRGDDTYETYRDRVLAMGSLDHPESFRNPNVQGIEIDRRARKLLAAAGVERPDYRQYRDACAVAAAQLEVGRP